MLAFHNDPAIKDKYLARVEQHQKADEIVQGYYWENGKGCAVGCTIHGSNHEAYEEELGIPRAIARLEDGIFERLSAAEAKGFPVSFLKAIPVGADLSMVVNRWLYWQLVDKENGVIRYAHKDGKIAIERVATLLSRKIEGEEVSQVDLGNARTAAANAAAASADAHASAANAAAADAAAANAAAAYASSSAADAASSAADAASSAAYASAYAAADASAASAASKTLAIHQRDKLLELLASAPTEN